MPESTSDVLKCVVIRTQKEKMFDAGYRRRRLNVIICFLLTSVVLITSGIVLIVFRTVTYERLKSDATTLAPGLQPYEIFKKTPFDVYFDIYFFNWTNPEEFHDTTKRPKVKEVGPFRFLEVIEKTNITFHENKTVSFNRRRNWFFVEDQSPYGLDTLITTINPVAVSAAYTLRFEGFFKKKGFSVMLNALIGEIHLTKSAGEMLFDGYDDPLINLARTIPFVKKNMPPMEKFAWFYKRNGSDAFDGHFNMGVDLPNKLGELYNWNYANRTPYYSDQCGDIRGVVAEFYPKNLKEKTLEIFNSEMCRTVVLDYVGETSRKLIKGSEFTMGDHFLDNGTLIPENVCYCTGDCVPYGVMNVSSCRYGSPGFVSLPHFYKADPYYTSLIEGLQPSERHNFYIILEPTTGIPLEVAARLQLNMMVKPISGINHVDNINEVFFPMLWFEQVVSAPLSYSIALFMLLWLKEICLFTGISFILSGISIIFYMIYRACTTPIYSKDQKFIVRELVPLNQEKFS